MLVARRGRDGGHADAAEAAGTLLPGDLALFEQRLDGGTRIAADAFERLPLLAFAYAHRLAQSRDLRRVHQPGVIVLVAGEGQAKALDRVGDEQGRAVVVAAVERLREAFEVVAGEIGHQPVQLVVAALVDDPARLRGVREQPLAPRLAAEIGERRIIRVARPVDPVAQRLAARFEERGFEQFAVLQRLDPPAAARENLVEALEHAVGAGRVEALAVVVDDPPQVAHVVLGAFDQRLVDVALVELGIADQSDEAAAVLIVHPAVGGQIILDEAGEERDRHAEADRAGGEIDGNAVLGAAGIGLRPAEAAEILQRLAGLAAEQIMDRVQHRSGVRLDGDAVVGAERVEIKRGHDRGHRGAARLMPADLQPVFILADVVGVVDGPCRQPAQPLVENLQRFDVGGDGL